MADIQLKQDGTGFDIALSGPDLATDSGLKTAVIVSLFTDRLAAEDDSLPGDPEDRRGWWADAFPYVEGDKTGSRLWLLSREKQTQAVVTRAVEYAREALQWLLDDGLASKVDVAGSIPKAGMLGLEIEIKRPEGPTIEYRFTNIWEAMHAL